MAQLLLQETEAETSASVGLPSFLDIRVFIPVLFTLTRDRPHRMARCSSFTISAQLRNNEGAPDSRPAAASEVYYFCFVCEDGADVSAEFLQIHLGTLIHG